MSEGEQYPTPEENLQRFFDDAIKWQDVITRVFGLRWAPLFAAIRQRRTSIRFSGETSAAAFQIDPKSNEFIFFEAGFYTLRATTLALAKKALPDALQAYFFEIADVSYGLHELYHPEQGLCEFSIVQAYKRLPSGLDQIGQLDHISDNWSVTLMAAVYAAKQGYLTREGYLRQYRDLSYVLNRAAPLAFGAPDSALHKQKRRLMNWVTFMRADDALRNEMVEEVERVVGPVDRPLWTHFRERTGEIVLWECEPRMRVLGTARVRRDLFVSALRYREKMDLGLLISPLQAILGALRIDAASVRRKIEEVGTTTQNSG